MAAARQYKRILEKLAHQPTQIDNLSAVRYLLLRKSASELKITLHPHQTLHNYITHLTSYKKWNEFRDLIQKQMNIKIKEDKKLSHEVHQLHIHPELSGHEKEIIHFNFFKNRKKIKLELEKLEAELKLIHQIDLLLQDDDFLELLVAQDEPQNTYQKNQTSHQKHSISAIEVIATGAESGIEIGASVVDAAAHAITSMGRVLSIPIISDFFRGLNVLRESYFAIKDVHTPQRKTKIATGVFAGGVSLGVGIVGSLLLAGTGLMATGAAILITPIVIAAATIGVYSAALYRDGYTLHQLRNQRKKITTQLQKIECEFVREKEIVISYHINQLDNTIDIGEIKKIQDEINDKRRELNGMKHSKNITKAQALKNDLTDLCHKRNEKILRNRNLTENITQKFQENPRLLRISIQKKKLTRMADQIKKAQSHAKKKTFLSTLCVAGVGIALAAVCLTGVGALVLGIAATTLIVGASVARFINVLQERKDHAVHGAQQKIHPIHPVVSHFHTSELQIEKRLLHDQQDDIAHALIAHLENDHADIHHLNKQAAPQNSQTIINQPHPSQLSQKNKPHF